MGGFVAVATIVLSWLEYWDRNMKLCAMSFLIRIRALGFLFLLCFNVLVSLRLCCYHIGSLFVL